MLRNKPFTIDLKLLCDTDYRDTYRVLMSEGIPGTTPTVNADGTVTFTWTDSDVVGDHLEAFTVIAWDETTGAPSDPVDVQMDVRDVSAVCNDVEIDYDWSELKGAPLTIPVTCGMAGGLTVLSPPFIRLDESARDGYERTVEGGTFVTDGTTLTFTPSNPRVDLASAQLSPWSSDPVIWAPNHVHGPFSSVDVRFSD